jgi:AMIN domain-containing protein
MKVLRNLTLIVGCAGVLGAYSAGQTTAQVQDLSVSNGKDEVRIEVTVSSPVTPRVVVASQPSRLLLQLPGTVPLIANQLINVKGNGVESVRLAADNSATSLTTVVIALDQEHPYGLSTEGNKIILTVLPSPSAGRKSKRNGGAVPGAIQSVVGRLHGRRQETIQASSATPAPEPVPPPHALPPLEFPADQPPTTAPAGSPAPPATPAAGHAPASPSSTAPESNATMSAVASNQPNVGVRIAFQVKYVAEGVVYLDGGRSDGLAEGMKLAVRVGDAPTVLNAANYQQGQEIAEVQVTSVAEASAVAEVHNPQQDLKAGEWAYLSHEDTDALVAQRSLSATRKYPAVISFTEGDPLEEEIRAEVPRPPLPEINRARGRFGFDFSTIFNHGAAGGHSLSAGLMMRTDITRIHGTYWNLGGYWRGRVTSNTAIGQATLQDLINRTYHLALTYDNPGSRWVAGFGRLYLPWASSLDTIDGGYFGRRLGRVGTAGLFAGSTPDPTSWSYNPDRRIGGAFVNFEGGDYDAVHYSSTSGAGLSTLKWKIDRPFIFFENGVSYKRYLSIYHSLQADSPTGNQVVQAPGPGVNRSFFTLRFVPHERVELDLNHTYFRDIPTFDPQLVGTGLLDKYLFQGYSGGVRVHVVNNLWVYSTLGRSNRTSDAKASLNQLYGVTLGHLPWTSIRADVHYSRFNSSFGSGSYESVSLSRNLGENLRWEVLAGRQSFASPAASDAAHFINALIEANLGRNYFIQSGYTFSRGGLQSYDQWLFTFGYRFDTKSKGR